MRWGGNVTCNRQHLIDGNRAQLSDQVEIIEAESTTTRVEREISEVIGGRGMDRQRKNSRLEMVELPSDGNATEGDIGQVRKHRFRHVDIVLSTASAFVNDLNDA